MIYLTNVYKSYDKQSYVLKDLSLEIEKGDLVSIMGESGSGKTTLLNIIGTLDYLSEGMYLFDSMDLSKISQKKLSKMRNKKIGFVFQQYYLIPYLTVYYNVMMPLQYSKMKRKEKQEKVMKALSMLGIDNLKDKKINHLSGGEMQRVAIARAIVNEPDLLLCDEPTGNLDEKNTKIVLDTLNKLNENGTTIILVTHNKRLAKNCKSQYILEDGRVHKQ